MQVSELKDIEAITPERAALIVAKTLAYHHLDVEAELTTITQWAKSLPIQMTTSPRQGLLQINDLFFNHQNFHGNTGNYYDPRNSYLNEVMRRKMGIPITLSILYMALGRAFGLDLQGVGLPTHFVVRVPRSDLFVDVFGGGRFLDRDDCIKLIQHHMPLTDEWINIEGFFRPLSNRQMMIRLLNNLRNIYLQDDNRTMTLKVLRLQEILMAPDDLDLARELGAIYSHFEIWGRATRHLRHCWYHRPDQDNAALRTLYERAVDEWAKLN